MNIKKILENTKGCYYLIIDEYVYDHIDSPIYGWGNFYHLNGLEGDWKLTEEWDKKYHVFLY